MPKNTKVFGNYAVMHDTEKGFLNQGYRKMELNVTQTMNSFQFESRENLKNAAKNILKKQGASEKAVQNIMDKTIFNLEGHVYSKSQLAIIKASEQMSINDSLKETLKYLKNHAGLKAQKEPVFGEIWDLFNKEIIKDDLSYEGELADFEIDDSVKNIFAAA